jgi:CubicO group peptidase (beta-lactamase class C family)
VPAVTKSLSRNLTASPAVDKHVGNIVGTRFRIGSMNKMFTAAPILQLAGKLDLAAPSI